MSVRKIGLASLAIGLVACQEDAAPEPALLASDSDATAIAALDARIFDASFTSCDESELLSVMAEDLEFYHDIYGVIARDRQAFIDGTLPDCRKRQAGELPYLERRLTPGSMVVRRIGDDALMQTGRHSFWLRPPGEALREVETGVFTHLWERDGDSWRISRVISYDHVDVSGG